MAKKRVAAKRAVKKKATKRKRPSRNTTAMKAKAPLSLTIEVGCFGSVCDAKFRSLHAGLGEKVKFKAPRNDVTLTWNNGSPLNPATNPINIAKGATTSVFTVAKMGTFSYHPSCTNPPCGNLGADPEMIVP